MYYITLLSNAWRGGSSTIESWNGTQTAAVPFWAKLYLLRNTHIQNFKSETKKGTPVLAHCMQKQCELNSYFFRPISLHYLRVLATQIAFLLMLSIELSPHKSVKGTFAFSRNSCEMSYVTSWVFSVNESSLKALEWKLLACGKRN